MATNNLTTEQIARVFAMHLGCEVCYPDYDSPKPTVARLTGTTLSDIETTYKRRRRNPSGGYTNGDFLSFKSNGYHNTDALHAQLILRPLSAITDEDAIEVIGMISSEATKNAPNISHLINYLKNRIEDDCRRDYLVYQFLIQRGYAVPLFIAPGHPDNGKDAIQLGIAIEAFKNQQK